MTAHDWVILAIAVLGVLHGPLTDRLFTRAKKASSVIDPTEIARGIIRERRPCETAPNGTGARCTCDFDCANYWLRAKGFGDHAHRRP